MMVVTEIKQLTAQKRSSLGSNLISLLSWECRRLISFCIAAFNISNYILCLNCYKTHIFPDLTCSFTCF